MTDNTSVPEFDIFDGLNHFGTLRILNPGEVLFTLGDTGSEMYLVQKGHVDLFFEPGKKPKQLTVGELFGELAFIIGNHQRTATAIAGDDATEVRVFGQQALKLLVTHMPQELFRLFRHTCAYLVDSEKELLNQLNHANRELEYSLDHILRIRQELTCYRDAGLLDQQTGLLTRHCITMFLEKIYNRDINDYQPATLLFIHVHEEQAFSQQLGRKFEELILPWLAGKIRESIGPEDLIFREDQRTIGLLMPGVAREDADHIPATLLDALENNPIPLMQKNMGVRVSIGASVYQPGIQPEVFLQQAIRAMEEATDGSTNRVMWH